MSLRAPCCRMSATTSSTGFWYGFRPHAAGTTQKSQLCMQPRVASKTLFVRKRRPGSRSRRGNGRPASDSPGACS